MRRYLSQGLAVAVGGSLKLLSRMAGSETLDKLGAPEPLERLLYLGSKSSVATANRAAKGVRPVLKLLAPERMVEARGSAREQRKNGARQPELFDLTRTEAQELVCDSMQRFARERLRLQAMAADEDGAPSAELLEESHALGLSQLAVREGRGGAALAGDQRLDRRRARAG